MLQLSLVLGSACDTVNGGGCVRCSGMQRIGDTLSSLATEAAFNRETDGVVKYASGKQVYRNSVWISKALCIPVLV